jgi:GNAT superfamily N-acetyltransferase
MGRELQFSMIRQLDPTDAVACDAIIAGLPQWFGNADGIRECAEAVRSSDGLVADEGQGPVAFLTFESRFPSTVEITWMAVGDGRRDQGVGTALIDALADRLRGEGVRLLLAKTLSDREDPGAEYAATRAFYLARGFVPVMELDIWGPENPCQLLAKPL